MPDVCTAGLGSGQDAPPLVPSGGLGRFSLLTACRNQSSGRVALSLNGQAYMSNAQSASGTWGSGTTLVVGCSGDGARQGPQLVAEVSLLLVVQRDVGAGDAAALATAVQGRMGECVTVGSGSS